MDAEGTLFTIYELSNRESLKMLIWKNNYTKGFFKYFFNKDTNVDSRKKTVMQPMRWKS